MSWVQALRRGSVVRMVAGYVDRAGLGLPKIGPFGPFIGARVDIVRTRIGPTRMTSPRTGTRLTIISYGAPIGATHRHLSMKFSSPRDHHLCWIAAISPVLPCIMAAIVSPTCSRASRTGLPMART